MKLKHLSRKEAEGFYAVHRERPFFGELTEFMSSAPCILMVLQSENTVKEWRYLMDARNPAEAAEGTLRREFGKSINENALHGSGSDDAAGIEISYFFSKIELV